MIAKHLSFLAFLLAPAHPSQVYELVFYSGKGCHGQSLGTMITGQKRDECKRDYRGNAQSVLVTSTGAVDNNYMVTLFGNDDCNPDDEIAHRDEVDGCLDGAYGGFQVWDMSV